MDEKQLKLLLIFGSDASRVQEDLKKLQSRADELQKRVQTLRETMKLHQAVGKDTGALEKELEDITAELIDIDQKAQQAQSALRGMANSSRDIRDNLFNLRDIGEKLERIGSFVERAGQGILSPIAGAVQTYLQSASPFDSVAIAWKQAQADIQQSFIRIGAVATNELLPAVRAASDLVSKIADLIERNPELIKAALIFGGSLVALGSFVQLAGQVTMLIGIIKALNLGSLGALLGSSGKLLGGAALSTTGAVSGGIGLGFLGYEGLARSRFGQQLGLANLGQFATVAAYYAGSIFSEQKAREWALAIGELTGAIQRHAEAARDDAQATQEQLGAFQAYETARQQRILFERNKEQERDQIIAEFASQRVDLEKQYEVNRNSIIAQFAEQRAQLMRQFALTERRAEEDYYQSRLKLSQSYQLEVRRAEQDHQRRIHQLRQEHEARLEDLIADRDALGIVREQRAYERQRQEEEENYRIQAARRSEDFARQLQELDAQFAIQRQRRLEDFRLQMAELAKQYQLRMKQLQIQHQEELRQLEEQKKKRLQQFDTQYKKELEQLIANEQNRLNVLRTLALNDQAILQQAGMELTQRYKAWLESQIGNFAKSTSGQGRASGGFVNAWQPYLVGEQGPELFVPAVSGSIVPNNLTRSIINPFSSEGQKVIQMKIETSTLSLQQVITEVEKLISKREQILIDAITG